jgi:hypothetical protein
MKKFRTLLFKYLPNAAHYQFCARVSDVLSTAGVTVITALGDTVERFNRWLAKETALMEWIRKNVFTAQISEADRRMTHALVALNAQVHALEYSSASGFAEAAHEVMLMLKNYGKVYRKPYEAQEGDMMTILSQLTGTYAAAVTLLGLDACVAELQSAFTEFKELLAQRDTLMLQKPEENFATVRRGIEKEYHQIVMKVNAGAALDASPDFAAFINALNPEIERLNLEFHRVRRNINAAQPAPIPSQTFTGDYLTPMPDVYYTNPKGKTEKLVLGRDYNLTYRHNRAAGNAECTLHGKGLFYGRKTVTFMIEHPL